MAPSAISAHPHHGNPPLPDVCVLEVDAGVTCTVAVRLVTDVVLPVLVWVTVFVFGGAVTVVVVVLVPVSVDVDVLVVVVVVVSLVATGSAVPVAVRDAAEAVVRLVLTCEATLEAADLAS